jgi:hypothetical protein
MSGKIKIGGLVLAAALVVLAGTLLVLNAAPVSNTVVKVKARFINQDANGNPLGHKIENDIEGYYYENVGNNILEIMDSSKQGKCIFLTILTDRFSPRFVNLYFDDLISGPYAPEGCTKPYFVYGPPPYNVPPIETVKLHMKVQGEWEKIEDPSDPNFPTLQPKNVDLNFLTMTDGLETYVYIPFFYFNVPDLPETKKVNESSMDYWFLDCLWAKIKADWWDGVKVNRWTLTPVTIPFKHRAWDYPTHIWCYHSEGAIPYKLFSNASSSCVHATYRMPWELEIIRADY